MGKGKCMLILGEIWSYLKALKMIVKIVIEMFLILRKELVNYSSKGVNCLFSYQDLHRQPIPSNTVPI